MNILPFMNANYPESDNDWPVWSVFGPVYPFDRTSTCPNFGMNNSRTPFPRSWLDLELNNRLLTARNLDKIEKNELEPNLLNLTLIVRCVPLSVKIGSTEGLKWSNQEILTRRPLSTLFKWKYLLFSTFSTLSPFFKALIWIVIDQKTLEGLQFYY